MSNPDPTPPSPTSRMPPWAKQMERELHQLRKDHEALKSQQKADNMSHIHLLSGIATAVATLNGDMVKLNKQIWGAIKEIRQRERAQR